MFHHRFFFSQLVIWPSKIRTPAGLRGRVLEHLPCRCRTKVTVGWAKIAAEKNRWLFVPWCKRGDWHRWRRCLRFMWISFVETVAAGRPKSWYIMIYHEFLNHKRSIMHLALSISELSRIRWIEGWKDRICEAMNLALTERQKVERDRDTRILCNCNRWRQDCLLWVELVKLI